jgi:cytochrome c oxidase accessory protein FixG
MFDRDTLIITYDRERGDPRGSRSRSADPRALGLGDCVDCGICVQACPTGIDIRNGLQYECIGCAACIDGCNQVMDKLGYPRGLIRYSTENAMSERLGTRAMLKRVVRPRVLVYGAILLTLVVGAGIALSLRVPLKLDVIRDRATLSREVEDGEIENVYRLQVMNTAEERRVLRLSAHGLEGAHIAGQDTVEMEPASTLMVPVRVRAPGETSRGSHPIFFELESADGAAAVREKSVFLVR